RGACGRDGVQRGAAASGLCFRHVGLTARQDPPAPFVFLPATELPSDARPFSFPDRPGHARSAVWRGGAVDA
ncbi:hypothetical protein EY06_15195, partial [Staphylococcus aureus]